VSTTSPLGPAVVMEEQQQLRKSEQADGSRHRGRGRGRARSLTRSAETGQAEAKETLTHAGRAACCYARKQPRLLGRRKDDDAVCAKESRRERGCREKG
jgi:hypothetical protein